MIAFQANEEQTTMRDAVAQFAQRTLRPRAREFERARGLPDEVLETAHSMGLTTAALPEAIGGGGLGAIAQVLIDEELAFGDPAAAFALGGPGPLGLAVRVLGGPDMARVLLAPYFGDGAHARCGAVAWGERKAPTDRPGLTTTASRAGAGWRLQGEKSYVANADRADRYVVFAQEDAAKGWDGLAAFVVSREAPGLRVLPRADTLGLNAASFGGIALDGVDVPDTARLPYGGDARRIAGLFAMYALPIAARAVGLARAAFETTRDYCEQRKAFGKPIAHFQAVAFTVAERAMDIEAARAMVWRAAWLWDEVARGAETASERTALQHTAWAV
jgi:acyl-CoA dehydrogenase